MEPRNFLKAINALWAVISWLLAWRLTRAMAGPASGGAPAAHETLSDASAAPAFFTWHRHTTVTERRPSYMRSNSFLTLRLTGSGVLRVKVYTPLRTSFRHAKTAS